MDFEPSARTQALLPRVVRFIEERIAPVETRLWSTQHARDHGGDWTKWTVDPEVVALKEAARAEGLWNLFLPDETLGEGLGNADYAPLAEAMGRSFLAPEIFNCAAPDTGNMEVLWKFGTPAQKERWLTPLLEGRIRSAFCMTEPDVASSDATNMQATAKVEGDEVVINGRKWWTTGLGHPECEILLFMGLSDPDAPRHQQHTIVLVPRDAPGVTIERMLPVFGAFDAPYGHGEVRFEDVRVPVENIVAGPGMGFFVAQGRLGPGRIHHCMRCIGAAERALELLIDRGLSREAFGKPLLNLGGNRERVADLRIAIDQARLLTHYAAWKLDRDGALDSLTEISAIKVVAPNVLQRVTDEAIQIFGGAGVSEDVPLTALFAVARVLRIADGPDAVHRGVIARQELRKARGRK